MNAIGMKVNLGKTSTASRARKPGAAAMSDQELRLRKTMLLGCMSAAAPVLVALVVLVSVPPATVSGAIGLGRMGVLSLGAFFGTFSYMLWRRRWWAGLPVVALLTSVAAYLGLWVSRPLGSYYAANPVRGLEDLVAPLILLSPYLVVGLIALSLAWVVGRSMALARRLGPLPVSRHAWSVLMVWAVMLLVDVLSAA